MGQIRLQNFEDSLKDRSSEELPNLQNLKTTSYIFFHHILYQFDHSESNVSKYQSCKAAAVSSSNILSWIYTVN